MSLLQTITSDAKAGVSHLQGDLWRGNTPEAKKLLQLFLGNRIELGSCNLPLQPRAVHLTLTSTALQLVPAHDGCWPSHLTSVTKSSSISIFLSHRSPVHHFLYMWWCPETLSSCTGSCFFCTQSKSQERKRAKPTTIGSCWQNLTFNIYHDMGMGLNISHVNNLHPLKWGTEPCKVCLPSSLPLHWTGTTPVQSPVFTCSSRTLMRWKYPEEGNKTHERAWRNVLWEGSEDTGLV